jgi:hypothetical protein
MLIASSHEELTARLVTYIESFAPSRAVTPLIRSSFADTMRELRRLLEHFLAGASLPRSAENTKIVPADFDDVTLTADFYSSWLTTSDCPRGEECT